MRWWRRWNGKNKATTDNADMKDQSNRELLERIELIVEAGVDMDTDQLEACLDELQKRAPVMEDYDSAAEWAKTKEEYPLLFEIEPSSEAVPAKNRKIFRSIRAVEIFVAAALCLIITANAFGYNPVKMFLDWADGVIMYSINPSGEMSLPQGNPSEYHSLTEAMEAYGVDTTFCPQWIPKEYALSSISVRDSDGLLRITGVYESGGDELLIRVTQYSQGFGWDGYVERDEGGEVCLIGNVEAYIVTNSNQSKAGWVFGECLYEVSGQVTEDEIKGIIKSIS